MVRLGVRPFVPEEFFVGSLIINRVGVGGFVFGDEDSRIPSGILISHSINCRVYPNLAFINYLKFT